jgi:hypothetical protein
MTQILTEVQECALCKHAVVYFGGRFQHLTDQCPDHWSQKMPVPEVK